MPNTKAFRIAQAAVFYPTHCKMPQVGPADTIRLAAQDLIQAIQNKHQNAPINLNENQNQALRELAEIFHQGSQRQAEPAEVEHEKENNSRNNARTSEGEGGAPRVNNQPSSSHDATAPRVLRTTKRIHGRRTRNNQPIEIQEVNENNNENTNANASTPPPPPSIIPLPVKPSKTKKTTRSTNNQARDAKEFNENKENESPNAADTPPPPPPPQNIMPLQLKTTRQTKKTNLTFTPTLKAIQEHGQRRKAPSKSTLKHDARFERRRMRAKVKEQEEQAIQDAIKGNHHSLRTQRVVSKFSPQGTRKNGTERILPVESSKGLQHGTTNSTQWQADGSEDTNHGDSMEYSNHGRRQVEMTHEGWNPEEAPRNDLGPIPIMQDD